MKKRVLFTSAVVALTMGLSLDAQAQRVRGINAQIPFGGNIAIGKQTAKNLVPNKRQIKAFSDVLESAQPGPIQAFAYGRTAKSAIKHLGSFDLPEFTVDLGSYHPQKSQFGTGIKNILTGVGNGIGAFAGALAPVAGALAPVVLGVPQPQ